jgi:hypothetical protein
MERRDDEAPFPREPWQRLLGESADGPPETTDARIRASARRDLAPRAYRWWLPASLAASFVLAVMIVRSEFGTLQQPVRIESDVAGDSAIDARLIERGAGPEARETGKSPSTAAQRPAPARAQAAPEDYGYDDAETGPEDAGVGPSVGGPEHELRAASEQPGETATFEETRIDLPRQNQALESAAVTGTLPAAPAEKGEPAAAPPTPETWYAEIRKMIAEGHRAEAERELEALRKAYPDWAAKNVKAADLR